MKNKVILLMLTCLLLVGCASNDIANKDDNKAIETTQMQEEPIDNLEKVTKEEDENKVDEELLKSIEIEVEKQDIVDGKQKIVVYTKNNTDKIFSGNLLVKSKALDNKTLDKDMIFVEELKPYDNSYAIIFFEPYDEYSIETTWSHPNFIESDMGDSQDNVLDEDLTEQVKKYAFETWGGCGHEELTATWYKNILDIKVFSNGGHYYAEITTDMEDESKFTVICMSVLQFRDTKIDRVDLLNTDGEAIFHKANNLN